MLPKTQNNIMKKQTFLGGVAILILCSIIAKFLGAVYRIPLTWILGGEGLGLYQLVFPLFSLLLVISSTGMPTAISKMIAKREGNINEINQVFKISLITLLIFGVLAGLFMFLCANLLSSVQGNELVTLPYMVISFAIVFVSILSAFRGYFQGRLNMVPTAVSNVVEQSAKLIFGLVFSYLLIGYGLVYGVVGAILGVVLSEVLTVVFMFVYYLRTKKKDEVIIKTTKSNRLIFKELVTTSFPIVIASFIIPFTIVVDSFLVINLLTTSEWTTSESTIMWGINSGVVNSILNVPVVLTLGVATAVVPFLSSKSSDKSEFGSGLWLVMNIAIPSVIGVALLSGGIINFLYANSLDSGVLDGYGLASQILLFSSGLIILMAFLQTQNAGMQGLNHSKIPVINLLIAAIIKIVLLLVLVPINEINIFGVIISNYAFYGCAVILNAIYLKFKEKINLHLFKNLIPILGASVVMALSIGVANNLLGAISIYISLPICIAVGIIFYLLALVSLRTDLIFTMFSKFKELKKEKTKIKGV